MVINGDVISLTKKEIIELINEECTKRLQMTITEFIEKQKAHKLPKTTAVHDIEMMLKLAK